MKVLREHLPVRYFEANPGAKGVVAAQRQYRAWLKLTREANWKQPVDVKGSHPKASILKAGRVVFNIKGNDYRLVARINYPAAVVEIRFFGSHLEYDQIDAETV
jgi:mRNA interferase HigB